MTKSKLKTQMTKSKPIAKNDQAQTGYTKFKRDSINEHGCYLIENQKHNESLPSKNRSLFRLAQWARRNPTNHRRAM